MMTKRAFIKSVAAATATAALPGCRMFSSGDRYVSTDNLGVCSWSYQKPLDTVAAEMQKIGLRRIHLALQPFLEGGSRHGAAENAAALDRVKARLASGEWTLNATMIGFPQEDYTTLDSIRTTGGIVPDNVWEANKKIIVAGAKLSAELKAPFLTMHAGFLDEHDPAALRKYTDRVKFIVDTCGERGVPVAFETGQETAADLAKFLASVPGAGVNFDPANMILYGKGNPVEAVRILAPWIRHIHCKDAVRTKKPGTWGTEVPWGDGEVNAPLLLATLKAAGYKGAFAIEREGGNDRTGDIALAARRLLA
ncbi:MAG: sugar phosphate isomerase/epimerase [Kiritimatiellae bacterium]|nr:sugar phosphate isomerase/epimerase [Clostridia bacterium]MBP5510820.1 sugar phosphate isomerase/epimerase [Kiritimatiellia bacterium]